MIGRPLRFRPPHPAPAALATLALGLALGGCGREMDTRARPAGDAVPVDTAIAEARLVTRFVEVPGTVRPVERATISPRVMGVIESLPVGLGSIVRRGDVLARISARDIAARVDQAEARLAQLEGDLRRESTLLASGASTSETVRALETQHRSAQAALEEARTLLAYTTIAAPFDGTITRRPANEGDLASPGIPLLEIEGTGRLRVEAEVPESLALLQPGIELRITSAHGPARLGRLAEISPSADTSSRTALAKVDLPAEATDIRSGQFVRVEIPASKERVIVAPRAAISPFGQLERVFIVDHGEARLRLVRTGSVRDEQVEILAGLDGGETLVLHPPVSLRDGISVAPR